MKRRPVVGALLRQLHEVGHLIGRRFLVEVDDERAGRRLDNRLLWRRGRLEREEKRNQNVRSHHSLAGRVFGSGEMTSS
jgi:hypothetical protein